MKDSSSLLIAVVDDDESVREATSGLLRSNGFRAETFSSAEDFLDSLSRTTPECLVLDIGMPGMSGLELQRYLAADVHRVPIVFVTARDSQELRREAIQSGAVDCLAKPFSEEALLVAIRNGLKVRPNNKRKIP